MPHDDPSRENARPIREKKDIDIHTKTDLRKGTRTASHSSSTHTHIHIYACTCLVCTVLNLWKFSMVQLTQPSASPAKHPLFFPGSAEAVEHQERRATNLDQLAREPR